MTPNNQAQPTLNSVNTLGIHRAMDSVYSKEILERISKKNPWETALGSLFLINVSTFFAVALCHFGLGIKEVCIYIACAYTIIIINGAGQFYCYKKHPLKKNTHLATEFFEDSALAISLWINATATEACDPVIAIGLVIAGIFILSAVSVKSFSGFIFSKLILLLAIVIYALFFGDESSSSLMLLFPLTATFVLLFSVGYWLYIRQVHILHLIFSQNHLHKTLDAKNQELANAHLLRDKIIRHIGHDLRQPINALSYAIFNIKSGSLNDDQWKQLQIASKSIESANYLIEEILQISAYKKSGAIDVSKEYINVSNILADLEREFFSIAQQSGCQLRTVMCSLSLHCDPQLVVRILRNFLSNAVRYAKGKKILLGVRRRNNYLEFQVLDNGPGMPKALLDRVFEEFTQGDKSAEYGGFGLGLNIAKNLSQAMGGEVSMNSEPGLGTFCTLMVPIEDYTSSVTQASKCLEQ